MFCPECGKQLPESARFCSKCGHAFTEQQSRRADELMRKDTRKPSSDGDNFALFSEGEQASPASKGYETEVLLPEYDDIDEINKTIGAVRSVPKLDPKKIQQYDPTKHISTTEPKKLEKMSGLMIVFYIVSILSIASEIFLAGMLIIDNIAMINRDMLLAITIIGCAVVPVIIQLLVRTIEMINLKKRKKWFKLRYCLGQVFLIVVDVLATYLLANHLGWSFWSIGRDAALFIIWLLYFVFSKKVKAYLGV